MKAVLAVNMKAYETAFGEPALELAREAARLASRYNRLRIILGAQALVATRLLQLHDDIFLQHADSTGFGAYTGFTPIEALKIEGLKGAILNHSEHKITYRELQKAVARSRELGLETLVCADTPEESVAVAVLKPSMIAVEPPELIGSGIPVSRAKPEVITRTLEAVRAVEGSIPVLAGAGISAPEDALRALELGAQGVLVASAIMKSSRPAEKLREFAESMATVV